LAAQPPQRISIPGTGEAKGAPACVNLVTYPVKVEGGRIFVKLG
jgi:nitrite reductase/ring-hydroxylating ferredoxin subunit